MLGPPKDFFWKLLCDENKMSRYSFTNVGVKCADLLYSLLAVVLLDSVKIVYKQHVVNIAGEPIDERGPVVTEHYAAIHAEAPDFVDMSVEQEILVTGIKVVDLLAPYSKGGKIGQCTSKCCVTAGVLNLSHALSYNSILHITPIKIDGLCYICALIWFIKCVNHALAG